MGKKEQVPARGRAIFMQGSLWEWSATSRGRPHDGGLALAVFHMVPRAPAAPNLFVHPPADLRKVLLPPSSRPARLPQLSPVVCPACFSNCLITVVCAFFLFDIYVVLGLHSRGPQCV